MYALVAYDVVDHRRRIRLHKFLKAYGLNTQKSVFECQLDSDGLKAITDFVVAELRPDEDCFRVYLMCRRCYSQVKVLGQGFGLETLDWLVL